MNKKLIKERFSRKLEYYNDNAKIQRQMAEKLIGMVNSSLNDSVLELGCGTGLLTELAIQKLNYKNYTAIDIVQDCEKFIKKINNDICFVSSDIEEYIKTTDEKYDLILSNASLQWIENLPEFIETLIKRLKPNGKIIFSTFGRENFREIFFVQGKTLSYFSKNELLEKLSQYSPMIEEEIRVMAFKTPKDVLKHIQNTGVNAISEEVWTKKDLKIFENEYNSFCSNHPTLTYNPIYVVLKCK